MPLLAQSSLPAPEDYLAKGIEITHLTSIYFGVGLVIYVVLRLCGRRLKRRYGLPLGWVYQLFCIAAALFLPSQLPGIDFPGEIHFGALLTISGAFLLIGFLRSYLFGHVFHQKTNMQVPKFFGQFISIAIILGALLFVLDGVYGIPVPGLLAGAGIAGLVLGLALQDTLGNIFSGFAIYFGGQFKAGDWLLVEGQHAKIVEINWRSTRLRTNDDVCLDIPNSLITKEMVINYNHPTSVHASRIDLGLGYDSPPTLVKSVLVEAALGCPHVLREPMPDVFLAEFGDWSITYQLRFWLADHARYNETCSQIRTTLWYALKRHNISIPYPIQHEMSLERPAPHVENRDLIRSALQKTILASCVEPKCLEEIVAAARIIRFGAGEKIVRQGAAAGPMFILAEGCAQVFVEVAGINTQVATLAPDACIGEASVLTGEARSATVVAGEDCLVVEVDKAILAPVIATNADVLEALSDLLTQRRLQNEGAISDASNQVANATRQTYKAGFLSKLKSFFEV